MARQTIFRRTDHDIKVIAPIKDIDNTVLNDLAGASSSFKVYDPSKDEIISATELSGQTVLSVTNAGVFVVNEVVEVTQDDASLHTQAITGVDADAGTITIASGLTVNAQAGNRVRVVLGTAITQVEFGTANVDTEDWGYIGVLPDNHPAHLDPRSKTGFDIDVETVFAGGAGLNKQKTDCLTIVEDDC